MSRSRNIKPGFFANDRLAECSPLARLLFAGLWTIADREGRLEDRPKRIKAEVLPYDDCDIDILLGELANGGFIAKYTVGNSKYIQVVAFTKHQNPHKNEADSVIPPMESEAAPYKHHTSTIQAQEKHSTNPADSLNLIPDTGFLIPDPLLPDTRVPEGEVVDSAAPENSDDWLFRKIDEEQDSRIRFQLPLNWKPGEKFGAYCNGRCAKGKPITPADLTQRILLDFVQSNNAKGERLTRHQWEQRLATYLQSRLENQKEPPPNDPTQDPNFRYPEFVPPPRVENPCTKEQSKAYAESLIAKLKETAMDNF